MLLLLFNIVVSLQTGGFRVDSLQSSHLAPNKSSRTVYEADFRTLRFSDMSPSRDVSLAHPTISKEILIFFVAHCFSFLQLKYSTIKTYLAGIRFTYIKAGFKDPWMLFSKWPAIPAFVNFSKSSNEIAR